MYDIKDYFRSEAEKKEPLSLSSIVQDRVAAACAIRK
jgi:hypothetical protein